MSLTFNELQIVNTQRSHAWHDKGKTWTLADWGNALAGEVGELCNIIKKIRRIETGVAVRETEADIKKLKEEAALEVADVIIYADLIATELGVFTGDIVQKKFNITSDQFGFPQKLSNIKVGLPRRFDSEGGW